MYMLELHSTNILITNKTKEKTKRNRREISD